LVKKLMAMVTRVYLGKKTQRLARKSCLKVDSKVRTQRAQVNTTF
jgi:hypothetical protein